MDGVTGFILTGSTPLSSNGRTFQSLWSPNVCKAGAITPPTMGRGEDWLANPCEAAAFEAVENQQRMRPVRKAKAIYSEFALARESATLACIWAEAQRQAEGGAKASWWKKEKASAVP